MSQTIELSIRTSELVLKSHRQIKGTLELRATRPLTIKNISLIADNQPLSEITFQGPMQLSELTIWEIPFLLKYNILASGKSFFPQLLGTGKAVQPDIGKMIMESQLKIVAKIAVQGQEEELIFRQAVELW